MEVRSSLVYLEQDGKYLMLHRNRKENDLNEGKWIGVGGKIEDEELPQDCALREFYEETGLTLEDIKLRGIVTFIQSTPSDKYGYKETMFLYTATEAQGEMKDCDEGELHWVPKRDVLSLNLWEGDKVFLELLDHETRLFSLELRYDEDRLVDSIVRFNETEK